MASIDELIEKRKGLESAFYDSLSQPDLAQIFRAQRALEVFVDDELHSEIPSELPGLHYPPKIKKIFKGTKLNESCWEDLDPYLECRVLSGESMGDLVYKTDGALKEAFSSGLADLKNQTYVGCLLSLGEGYGFEETVHALDKAVGGLMPYLESNSCFAGESYLPDIGNILERREEEGEEEGEEEDTLFEPNSYENDLFVALQQVPPDALINGFTLKQFNMREKRYVLADLVKKDILDYRDNKYSLNMENPFSLEVLDNQ